ncbi:MAG: peptide chain release factor N(5)-glutamine methyltransferase [Acidimicrobiia bacterium]|nr:peptide chain release factor N(5)-glutamine methyltransferase [Acidimicrobiia bacterium]
MLEAERPVFVDADELDADELPGPGVYHWAAIAGWAARRLERHGPPMAPSEIRWILETVGAPDRIDTAETSSDAAPNADRDRIATARQVGRLIDIVEDRVAGTPLQYALGSWAFRDFDLKVDRRVLIPRPETEQVADVVLAEAERIGLAVRPPSDWPNPAPSAHVLDLGTGSGALAITMVRSMPDVIVWATDYDHGALSVARANLAQAGLHAQRVRLEQGSWWEALPSELAGSFSIIVSNPPYIAEAEFADLPPEVRDFEPRQALVAGSEGLDDLEVIIRDAPLWLTRPGALICEIGETQADAVLSIAEDAGLGDAEVLQDFAGRDRILVARFS